MGKNIELILKSKGIKVLKFPKDDPNSIIDVPLIEQQKYNLPPKMKLGEYNKKCPSKIVVDSKALWKYLERKRYLEKEVFPKIKMTFDAAYIC